MCKFKPRWTLPDIFIYVIIVETLDFISTITKDMLNINV